MLTPPPQARGSGAFQGTAGLQLKLLEFPYDQNVRSVSLCRRGFGHTRAQTRKTVSLVPARLMWSSPGATNGPIEVKLNNFPDQSSSEP